MNSHLPAVVLFSIFSFSMVSAASFNCEKATTPIEQAICSDPVLDKLDEYMGNKYSELRKTLSEDESSKLKADQLEWIKVRSSLCPNSNADCLMPLYKQRIEYLDNWANKTDDPKQSQKIIESPKGTFRGTFDRFIYPGHYGNYKYIIIKDNEGIERSFGIYALGVSLIAEEYKQTVMNLENKPELAGSTLEIVWLKYPFEHDVGNDTMALSVAIIDNSQAPPIPAQTNYQPEKSSAFGTLFIALIFFLLIGAIIAMSILLARSQSQRRINVSAAQSSSTFTNGSHLNAETNDFKLCPSCAEKIQKNAKKCKHCGKSFQSIFTREIGAVPFLLLIIISAAFFGFFHVVPGAPGIPIIPKAHFTYSLTFITIDDFIDRWNNRSFGEAIRGDDLLENLKTQFQERGWITQRNNENGNGSSQ